MACDFCKGDKLLMSRNEHLSYKGDFYAGIEACIDGDILSIDAVADTYEPNFTEEEIKINFCPMCGQKLSDQEESIT